MPDEKPRDYAKYVEARANELLPKVAKLATSGGFSSRPFAEPSEPTTGTMVSLPVSAGLNLTLDLATLSEEELRAVLKPWLRKALLYLVEHPNTYLGGWYDSERGRLHFDVSDRYEDRMQAMKVGMERNQLAVYCIEEHKEYSTGGTGK